VLHRVFERGWAYGDLFKQENKINNMTSRAVSHQLENIGRAFGMVEYRGHGRGQEFWFGLWKIYHHLTGMTDRRRVRWLKKVL